MTENKELSSLIAAETQLEVEKETAITGKETPSLQNKEKFVKSADDGILEINENDAHFGLPDDADGSPSPANAPRAGDEVDNAHFGGETEAEKDYHFGGESGIPDSHAIAQPPSASPEIQVTAETEQADLTEFEKAWEETADDPREIDISAAGDDFDPDSIQNSITDDPTDTVTERFETNDDIPELESETANLEDPAEFDIGFEILNDPIELEPNADLPDTTSGNESDALVFDLDSFSEDISESSREAISDDYTELDEPVDSAEDTLLFDLDDVEDILDEVMEDNESDSLELDDDDLIDIMADFEENEPVESAEDTLSFDLEDGDDTLDEVMEDNESDSLELDDDALIDIMADFEESEPVESAEDTLSFDLDDGDDILDEVMEDNESDSPELDDDALIDIMADFEESEPVESAEDTLSFDLDDGDNILDDVMEDNESDSLELDDDALIDIMADFEESEPAESVIVNLWELAGDPAPSVSLDDNKPSDPDLPAGLTDLDDLENEALDDFDEATGVEEAAQFFVDEDDLEMDSLNDSDDLGTELFDEDDLLDTIDLDDEQDEIELTGEESVIDSDDLGTDLFDEDDLFDPIDLDDEQDVVELTGEESVIALDDDTILDLSALADDTVGQPVAEPAASLEFADSDDDELFALTDLAEEPATDENAPIDLIADGDDDLNLSDEDDLFDFTDLDDTILDLPEEETSPIADDDESLFEEEEPVIELSGDILDGEEEVIDLTAETSDDRSNPMALSDSTDEEEDIIELVDEDVDLNREPSAEDPDGLAESLGIDSAEVAASISASSLAGAATVPEITGAISREQLDEALERVVQKMLADKIDTILTEVIERAVTREINRIKGILLDNSSEAE